MRTTPILVTGLLATAAMMIGCSRGLLPAETVLPAEGRDAAALRALLSPGSHVVLRSGAVCKAFTAPKLDDLLLHQGTLLSASLGGDAPRLYHVQKTVAHLGKGQERGFFAVLLMGEDRQRTWVSFTMGQPLTCLAPATPAVVEATRTFGKKVVFSPWKDTCTRIEARGPAVASMLDSPPGTKLSLTGLVDVVRGVPWVGLERGTLRVPHDLLNACFTEGPAAPPSALGLIHTELGRCARDDDEGKDHIECRSSIGVWEGRASESAVSLRLVRRTLGAAHITDGRAVDGRRYARTVVAVSTGRPKDPRERELYSSIESAVTRTLAQGDGSIRVASSADPKVGHRLRVDASGLVIGDLRRTVGSGRSEYQDGERDVDNPAYPEAQRRVETATDELEQARRRYEQDREEHERNQERIAQGKEACIQGCNALKKAQDQAICKAACGGAGIIGGMVNQAPSRQSVEAARDALRSAERTFSSTPRTVKEPIMRSWTYTTVSYARPITVVLHLVLTPKGGAPREVTQGISLLWEDHEVTADPAHNVKGHEPDRAAIERPDALVPWLAREASKVVAARLPGVLEDAQLEDAKKALAADQSKPGFEAVDAKALETAGPRLRKAALRGRAHARAESPLVLPTESQALAEGECFMTVAVLDEASPGAGLTLSTEDGALADLRGKRFAAVEACAADLPASGSGLRFFVKSTADGEIRWSVYRTTANQAYRARR